MATLTKSTTVLAVFDTPASADTAVRELTSVGVDRSDISVIAHDRDKRYESTTGFDTGDRKTTDGTTVGENVAGGALFGGLGGLALGLAALAIPGIGPVVAAGPLATTLAGAAIGAAGGGIIGALKDAGVPDDEADLYAESVRRGGTLVTVHCDSDRANEISRILDRNGAVDVEERGQSYRQSGWSRFDQDAGPYDTTLGSGPGGTYTTGSSGTGTGTSTTSTSGKGTRTGAGTGAGMTSGTGSTSSSASRSSSKSQRNLDYGSGESSRRYSRIYGEATSSGVGWGTNAGSGMGAGASGGAGIDTGTLGLGSSYDPDYRNHWEKNYGSRYGDYSTYEPAYRWGSSSAQNSTYRDRSWEDIEDTMRTDYLRNNPNSTWDNVKGAVRYGWEKATGKRP
ncbi:MAG: hypothetical protein JNK87_17895 [Bryobacterales bacterium]|nr:hypothetical protein [Bryobacterales bacterium]